MWTHALHIAHLLADAELPTGEGKRYTALVSETPRKRPVPAFPAGEAGLSKRIAQLEAEFHALRSENRELKATVHRLTEHVEWLEDSLDLHLAKSEHENSGDPVYTLEEVEKELDL